MYFSCLALSCLAGVSSARRAQIASEQQRRLPSVHARGNGSPGAVNALASALFVSNVAYPARLKEALAHRGLRLPRPQAAIGSRTASVTMDESAALVEDLLKLCAITDRGQRATAADRARLLDLIQQSESAAAVGDATDLNGNWRLACSLGESVYRSSPFFWAFRQATAGLTTPVGIPGANVEAGDKLASAVYGITDSIPFYDVGPAVQRFSGVCSVTMGCPVPEGAEEDLSESQLEPSDGIEMPVAASDGSLESQVEIRVGRLFGLPSTPWTTQMTTTAVVQPLPNQDGAVEVELVIERTEARDSTIAQFLPQMESLLGAPSGAALEAVRKGSSFVRLRSTFPTPDVRISRPVLTNAPEEDVSPVFVYVREPTM